MFEEPPKGLPIGANLSERVVFNGYFLKIMKYQAGDVPRGAPLLVGRIGWDPAQSPDARKPGSGSTLKWTLVLLAVLFVINLGRWLTNLFRASRRRDRPASRSIPSNRPDRSRHLGSVGAERRRRG